MKSNEKCIPIDQCVHMVQSFPGACEMIAVHSGGRPIDGPARRRPRKVAAILRGLEIMMAFVFGLTSGMLVYV